MKRSSEAAELMCALVEQGPHRGKRLNPIDTMFWRRAYGEMDVGKAFYLAISNPFSETIV